MRSVVSTARKKTDSFGGVNVVEGNTIQLQSCLERLT